jgi:hypothetical protein
MSKPVMSWCAAAVLAVAVVLMHVLSGSWVPSIFPEWQTPITEPLQIGPWGKVFLMGYLALSVTGGMGVVLLFGAGVCTRDRQRWAREEEMRRQLWEMEEKIREESLSEEERAWHQAYRARQREIHREARRRLGLPEEDAP